MVATPVSAISIVPPGALETSSLDDFMPGELGLNTTATVHVPIASRASHPSETSNSAASGPTAFAVIPPLRPRPTFVMAIENTDERLETATVPRSSENRSAASTASGPQ